jgi:aminoglycoside 2'-N-acetyltransferase I
MLQVSVLSDDDMTSEPLAQVRSFVFDAFAGRFSEEDWEHAAGGWRVILFEDDVAISHAAVVLRTLRIGEREFRAGYVEAVATLTRAQHQGHGSTVLRRVTSLVRSHFELGALCTGRRDFYEPFGWETMRGPSYVQDGEVLVRTPDEDDCLMVLRFGPSAGVDLTAAIVCEARNGDDW